MQSATLHLNTDRLHKAFIRKDWADQTTHEFAAQCYAAIETTLSCYGITAKEVTYDCVPIGCFAKNKLPLEAALTLHWSGGLEYKLAEITRTVKVKLEEVLKKWMEEGKADFTGWQIRVHLEMPIGITLTSDTL